MVAQESFECIDANQPGNFKEVGIFGNGFSVVSVKAEEGGLGRGLAVREYSAVGPICSTSVSQIS